MDEKLIVSRQDLQNIKNAVVAALEVSGSASSKATHYHTRQQQIDAVKDHLAKLHVVGKELPLVVASLDGAQGFYIQQAILQELEASTKGGYNTIVSPQAWDDEGLGRAALYACFRNLDKSAGIPYVLRMLAEMRERKVNNARSRRYALEYIWGHPNLEFVAVKYRAKLRKILTHVYGTKIAATLFKISNDRLAGLSDARSNKLWTDKVLKYAHGMLTSIQVEAIYQYIFENTDVAMNMDRLPVMRQVAAAMTDVNGCDLVPEEVLTGLLSHKSHPQHEEMWSTKEKQAKTLEVIRKKSKVETANVAVRKTKQEKERGIEREVDIGQVSDPIALFKTGFETEFTDEIIDQIDKLAEKHKYQNFPYRKVGVLLDGSYSMTGHFQESKNTPRAVAEFIYRVLNKSALTVYWKTHDASTSLAVGFLGLVDMQEDMDAIFILSDGYENDYEGLLGEVIKAWRDMGNDTPVFHISPIGGAEVAAKARRLAEGVASFAATYRSLPVLMQANLLEADPRGWLKNQVERLALTSGVR